MTDEEVRAAMRDDWMKGRAPITNIVDLRSEAERIDAVIARAYENGKRDGRAEAEAMTKDTSGEEWADTSVPLSLYETQHSNYGRDRWRVRAESKIMERTWTMGLLPPQIASMQQSAFTATDISILESAERVGVAFMQTQSAPLNGGFQAPSSEIKDSVISADKIRMPPLASASIRRGPTPWAAVLIALSVYIVWTVCLVGMIMLLGKP